MRERTSVTVGDVDLDESAFGVGTVGKNREREHLNAEQNTDHDTNRTFQASGMRGTAPTVFGLHCQGGKQVAGIEPASPAWKAGTQPISHTCMMIVDPGFEPGASAV